LFGNVRIAKQPRNWIAGASPHGAQGGIFRNDSYRGAP